MKVKEIAALIEAFAPLSLQEEYDNAGLNVGSPEAEVTGVLLCVDVTETVLDEALSLGANLIVSHHPLLFHPLRQLIDADHVQRIASRAILSGLSLYAAHTNLDAAPGGLSFRLGERIGLQQMQVLAPDAIHPGAGFGVVGVLKAGPQPLLSFMRQVKETLRCGAVRYSRPSCEKVGKVALSTGSGGSFIRRAMAVGADLFITADLRYNDFFTPGPALTVADVGHFESEYVAIDLLHDIIREKIATFAVHKSSESNPVNYLA